MSYQELADQGGETTWLQLLLEDPGDFIDKAAGVRVQETNLAHYLWRGSMPGTIPLPDGLIQGYENSYIQTYVERDVKQVENIREMAEFDRFLGLLGALTAQEINVSHLGREIGMSPTTSRKWLDILTNTYQWRQLPPYFGNAIKRISGKHKGYLCDTGMACNLQRISTPETLLRHPLFGAMFETWVVNEIKKLSSDLQLPPNIYHWRTAAGAEVDIILEWNGRLYPIEVKGKANLTKGDLSGLRAFRSTYTTQNIADAVVIYAGDVAYRLDEHTLALPWNFTMSCSMR
jgi:predicted AAA+ superfamily ATPase